MPKKKQDYFDPYGSAIFCEDVRYERNGQVSLIGVYNTDLSIAQIPSIVPKLGLAVTIVTPSLRAEDLHVKLDVYLPGDIDEPSISVPNFIPADKIPPSRGSKIEDIPPHAKIALHLVISPLEIKSEGYIKVRVVLNELTIKAGVIRVNLKSEHSVSDDSSPPKRMTIPLREKSA